MSNTPSTLLRNSSKASNARLILNGFGARRSGRKDKKAAFRGF
jgi:hypothetical protein